MKLLVLFLVCVVAFEIADGARILGIFSIPGRSHYILAHSLLKGLAEKGHNVTMISCFGKENGQKNTNYRDIVLTGLVEKREAQPNNDLFEMEGSSPFVSMFFMSLTMPPMQELGLSHESVQKLLQSDETFDVVILEQFLNDAQKALALHYNAPLVVLSTIGANSWVNQLVGNPSPTSYVPEVLLEYGHPMSFHERLTNTVFHVFHQLLYNLYVFPEADKAAKRHISKDLSLYDVLYNASIVLMNSHPSINQPVPYVPNMIDIGGYHIKPPKPLPSDLQKFLDEAKEGVIYFSMGSNLKSTNLPVEKRDALLKAFSKLKVKVLWKWEDDVLPGQPPNVKLGKWLPQPDILAHPNIKLFITHGGYLSTSEAIYHGVPILAIPIFGDQKMNARSAANNGYGVVLPYTQITEEALTEKINELLHNPKYRENAQLRSKLFHDRPVSPMDTANYWVEYVIRHKGAPHLRVAGLDLPWYQYYLLDLAAFLGLVVLVGLFVLCKVSKFVFKRCSKSSTKLKKY